MRARFTISNGQLGIALEPDSEEERLLAHIFLRRAGAGIDPRKELWASGSPSSFSVAVVEKKEGHIIGRIASLDPRRDTITLVDVESIGAFGRGMRLQAKSLGHPVRSLVAEVVGVNDDTGVIQLDTLPPPWAVGDVLIEAS